jgi:phosphopantothenoylcysteine decarboxylase/phosphopantothenate--cysteine ligase
VNARKVLLIVGGGIAAYKALELVRLLRKASVEVRCILTPAGAHFVTPLSLATLSENAVRDDLWSLTDEMEMGHIALSRWADLLVVAPATADLMAKAAHGRADDLASTTLLATDKPVLMAPAMNVRMWTHPATRRNLAQLHADRVAFVGPDDGEMACGEFGPGRLAEPEVIAAAVIARLDDLGGPRLDGRRVLVTAGPTQEPLDPVRYLSNHSSGRQGYAIAQALARRGAEVVLVSGPTELPAPPGVERVAVGTAEEMLQACEAALPVDAAVLVAAVADWRVAAPSPSKLKGKDALRTLELTPNPDILQRLSAPGPTRPRLVVGFAAETDELEANARAKLEAKGCDWIVANDVRRPGVMGGGENTVILVRRSGVEAWPPMSKQAVGERLAAAMAQALS